MVSTLSHNQSLTHLFTYSRTRESVLVTYYFYQSSTHSLTLTLSLSLTLNPLYIPQDNQPTNHNQPPSFCAEYIHTRCIGIQFSYPAQLFSSIYFIFIFMNISYLDDDTCNLPLNNNLLLLFASWVSVFVLDYNIISHPSHPPQR